MTYDPRPDVIIFGGCNLDVIARADRPLRPGVSNPGTVYVGAGGAGRNVAVNLVRLGVQTALVSAVGRDAAGDYLVAETARAGVDVSWIARSMDRSNYYVAVAAGADVRAISDMAAADALTVDHLAAAADAVAHAEMAVIDANLAPRTIRAAVDAAGATPICLLPTSPAKAPRLSAVLDQASLIVASAAELEVLSGLVLSSAADALGAAIELRARTGADVVVSMGPAGIGLAAVDAAWLESLPVAVVDVTGAGDAVAAAAVFARLRGFPPTELLRLARAAGAMTVTIPGATHPSLSVEALRAYV
jgi:pseudouridine kinase